MVSLDHEKLDMIQKKMEDWSSIYLVVDSRAIRIDQEVLKYGVIEELIVSEPWVE